MKVDKQYIEQICVEYFDKKFTDLIDELVKPYLGKNGFIAKTHPNLAIYYINHTLYDMAFKSSIHIDIDLILDKIEIYSKQYIDNNYVE